MGIGVGVPDAKGIPGPQPAGQRDWVGGGADDNWNTDDNWQDPGNGNANDAPPSGGNASLVFQGETQTSSNNDFGDGYDVADILFSNDGSLGRTAGFVLDGNSIDIGSTDGSGGIVSTAAVSDGLAAITDTIALDMELFASDDIDFEINSNHHLRVTGIISDQTASGSGNTNLTGLTKSGAGTLILEGENTYPGVTVVEAGTLLINGDTSGATGDVTVALGATLGGSGTVGGATTINGIHSPGNAAAGVQTFSNDLTYGGGSSVLWELFADTTSGRGTSFDGINVGGDLTFANATTLELDFSQGNVDWGGSNFWGLYNTREWRIWNVAGNINYGPGLGLGDIGISLASSGNDGQGNAFDPGSNVPSSANFYLFENANGIYLRYEALPEPTTFGLLGLMMAGLVAFVRPKRKRR